MISKIIKIILLVCLSYYLQAQSQLINAEYFIDTDPGVGNGIPIPITSGDSITKTFSIPTSGITTGYHKLVIRTKNADGLWSVGADNWIYVVDTSSNYINYTIENLVSAEYFFDTDPGVGNGISIPVSTGDSIAKTATLPTTGLESGYHKLTVRVKNNKGLWSLGNDTWVYVIDTISHSVNQTQSSLIAAEYFIDNDPGAGNGIQIPITPGDSISNVFNFTLSGVNVGFHRLVTRVKNAENLWSIVKDVNFYVYDTTTLLQPKTLAKLTEAEYYYDSDPGFGNGFSISLGAVDSVTWSNGIFLDTLMPGLHTFIIRVKDQNNAWSMIKQDTFRIADCYQPNANFSSPNICEGDTLFLTNTTSNTDTLVKYYWDIYNDGVYDFSANGDTSLIIDTVGTLNIKLKAINSDIHKYSCPDSIIKTVNVHSKPFKQITVYGDSSICPGSSVSIGTSAGIGYTYQWLKNGTPIPNANNAIYSAQSNGNYQAAVTSFYGCKDTSSITAISMYSIPMANITASGPTNFCAGDSVTLNASSGIGLNYQWYKNGIVLNSDTLQSLTVNTPGSYKVQISNSDGCVNESSPEIVTVNPLPIVNLFALSSTAFCMGDSVTLQTNQGSNYSYNWFKDGILLTNDTNYQLVIDSSANVYVELTDQNNCSSTSSSISIISFDIPSSDFIISNDVCANDTISVSYTGTGSSGAFYNWDFDGATVVNGSGQGPYSVIWNSAGAKDVSLSVSENGCASAASNSIVNVNAISAVISSANTSVCNGDSIFITANSGTDFTYQWLQGGIALSGENSSFLNVSSTGNYQVIITDTAIGCSQISNAIVANVFTNDFNLDFAGNTTSFTQPPFDVNFSNNTPNMSNYQFEWDFGDGNTSNFYQPFHSYQYNGNYSVKLYAENVATGCKDTLIKTDYISCTGGAPNPCNIIAAITPAGPATICNGDSVMLTASAGTGYTYQWARNGLIISGADSIIFWAKQAGNYRVIVSDAVCSQTSPPFVLNHYPSIEPYILVNGSIQPCTDDSLELFLPTSYINYNWSTGDTTPNIYINQTGYYTVAVTDHYGCNMTSQPETVNASFLSPPEVCIVGVDSNNHNRIIWERPVNALIDSIYVYRESVVAGQYNIIGALDYDDYGIFSDTNSNPAIRSYRYRLAALDTCGAITLMSNLHKTIHLTINAGLNGSWNLIWDGYSGFQFGSYRIYRGTSTNSMSLLTQLPSTSTSYTDLNPPSGTVYYQIEVVKATGCYPDSTFSKANTNYNSSRSNVANNASIAPVYLTADFDANVLTGQWPIQVSFNDLSTGSPTSWIWSFGDGNTSVEQNPKHTYNNTGLYDIQLVACNSGICDTTIKQDYINVLPNGLVEIGVVLAAKIYPNPNDGSFTLEINSKKSKDATVYIYNNIGQLVYSEEFKVNSTTYKKLDLNSQAKGIYHVHLSTDKGVVYREKVVVK